MAVVLRPVIEKLRNATGESAAVFLRRGLERTCVAVAETRHAVIWQLHVGMSTPLYVGSGGRAILAFDSAAITEVLAGDRHPYTSHTVTGEEELREVLERTRSEGMAISQQELDHDVAGVSAPIFDASGAVSASVGVAGPAQRFTDAEITSYVPAVWEAARAASNVLGGTSEPDGHAKTEA